MAQTTSTARRTGFDIIFIVLAPRMGIDSVLQPFGAREYIPSRVDFGRVPSASSPREWMAGSTMRMPAEKGRDLTDRRVRRTRCCSLVFASFRKGWGLGVARHA